MAAGSDLEGSSGGLGTTNYVRPHAGPTYAKVMYPLRALLKSDAVFPPNAEQLEAIEGLKNLVQENWKVSLLRISILLLSTFSMHLYLAQKDFPSYSLNLYTGLD